MDMNTSDAPSVGSTVLLALRRIRVRVRQARTLVKRAFEHNTDVYWSVPTVDLSEEFWEVFHPLTTIGKQLENIQRELAHVERRYQQFTASHQPGRRAGAPPALFRREALPHQRDAHQRATESPFQPTTQDPDEGPALASSPKGVVLMTHLLTQPAFLLATAHVPDRPHPNASRRTYGLVRVGTCYYALLFTNPNRVQRHPFQLHDLPVAFLQARHFPQAALGENEQGYLFARQRRTALTWFLDTFIRRANGVLTLENEDRERAHNPFRAALSPLSQEGHRLPEEQGVIELLQDVHANPDDHFLVTLDTFALRQIQQFEATPEPRDRAPFEEEMGALIGVCMDEYWIAEGPFEQTVATCTTRLISLLQQTRGLAVLERAERLVNELLVVLEEGILPHP